MLQQRTRRLAIVIAVVAIGTLLHRWVAAPSPEIDAVRPPAAEQNSNQRPADRPAPSVSSALAESPATAARTNPPREMRKAQGAPLQLEVRAPSDVQMGETFPVEVHLDASVGVRQLTFTLTFDNVRLALAGSSSGSLVDPSGTMARLAVEESSDGSVQVTLNVREGSPLAGIGTVVVLRLQAIARGTSAIALQDGAAQDAGGTSTSNMIAQREVSVTIH